MNILAIVSILASVASALPCTGPTCKNIQADKPLINLRIDTSEDSKHDGLVNLDALDRAVVARIGGTPLTPEEKGRVIDAEVLVSSVAAATSTPWYSRLH